ncbi:hypothetical protein [Dactylosporangium sp. CA-233914]|uniref:hypothetical protein n=1 Tax=Dactylosporangium sp. CA-233914 TaxID=3239934 RepID=UPI003D92DAED
MSAYLHYTVREIWEMVAHESAASHAEAARAWEAKHSMLRTQIGNLKKLRQDLADAWTPEGSPAAQAFLNQIDQTMSVMTTAQEAASQAKTSYTKVTGALISAQQRIKPLHDAYDDPKAAWRAYLAKTPAASLVSILPDDWAPNVGVPGLATEVVMRQHREELDKQARAIMDDTDARVSAATEQPVYMPQLKRYDEAAAPSVPSNPHGGGSGSSGGAGQHLPAPVFEPPPPNPDLVSASPGPATPPVPFDLGPFLTGTPTPVSPPVLKPPPPPPVAPLIGPPIALPPPVPLPGPPPKTGWLPQTPGKLMPTSGLIERPTAQPIASRPARAALGEPGVIGGRAAQSAGRPPMGRPAAEPGGEGGERLPGGGWRDRSYEAYTKRRSGRKRPEDEVWQVAQGVAPVLEAPPVVPTGDVPPGVIGIDR